MFNCKYYVWTECINLIQKEISIYILGNYLEYPTSLKILIKILTFSLKTKVPGKKTRRSTS